MDSNSFLLCIKFFPFKIRSICPCYKKTYAYALAGSFSVLSLQVADTSYCLAARTSIINLRNMSAPIKYVSINKLLWQIETESNRGSG